MIGEMRVRFFNANALKSILNQNAWGVFRRTASEYTRNAQLI